MTAQGGRSGDWLRVPAAAAVAGVSPAALRRRADAGDLPCYRRPGGPRFVRRRDAAALCDATRRADGAPPSTAARRRRRPRAARRSL